MDFFLKIFKALNSVDLPSMLALSFVLGMIMGLTPLFFIHNLAVLFLILVLRIHFGLLFAGFLLFKGLAYLIDPAANTLGMWLLSLPDYQVLYEQLYNNFWFRLLNFNNTLVMGSLAVSLIFAPFLFTFSWLIIKGYRVTIYEKIKSSKFVRLLQASAIGRFLLNLFMTDTL